MNQLTNENTISLDYIDSVDPIAIDQGIRETIRGVHLSILTMGIGLARIKTENLFKKLNFRNMSAYIESICEESKLDRSSVYNWLNIGEAYTRHRNDLEMIGFNDKDGPTKLSYLERALSVGEREEVFSNLKTMSKRDFAEYAKSGNKGVSDDVPFIEIRGHTVYVQGRRAIIVSKHFGKKYTNLLMGTVRVVSRAMERGGVIVAVHLRNRKEANRFKVQAKRIRAKMRRKY